MNLKSMNLNEFTSISIPILQSLAYQYIGQTNTINQVRTVTQSIRSLKQSELNEFVDAISHIYQCDQQIIKNYYQNLLREDEEIQSSFSRCDVSLKIKQKTTTQKVLQMGEKLKAALLKVNRDFGVDVNDSISNKDLCLLTNRTVEDDQTQQFWNQVAALIPNKTKKQIYDFYRASFSKVLFESHFTLDDKYAILSLNSQYHNMKPTQLADIFLQKTKRNILKREVIMQIVNIRKQELDSE
ncbi:Hypothetical_protein [Hexamita inflata]|uniref:Hypothetical_protein n=1 Tax=Hexamita inflata TaxID=28002 RepID=A0AA86RG81_9EUKA|nr:Hypothetical protein HINF_LOCUS64865 [Hexamita inflata]